MPKIFVWQGNWNGGAERITKEAAKYLSENGFDVTLGVFCENSKNVLPQIVYKVPTWVPSSFRALYASLIFRIKHANRFDAVYTHTLGAWKEKNIKLFVHEAADLDVFLANRKNILHQVAANLWHYLYLSLCLRRATLIFSATEEATKYFIRHGIAKEKIIASGSFFDERIFTCVDRALPQKPYKLLFIGNPKDPRKQFEVIKKYLYESNDYEVWVAGGTDKKQDKNITYFGYCDSATLFSLLQQVAIFVLPSKSEGFSIALLEALATGIPCIVNNSAAPRELIGTKNLATYKSEAELPVLMNKILQNFDNYAVCDNRINNYSRTAILAKETAFMKKVFALPIPGANISDEAERQ